ncbi:uncharacterized protein C8Q71DRAFT_287493 [Rhodofomes roseus]|uniref:DUF6535 domain-containing protein n=1 Tax=Rhodofomes roseus TaxID=34475 RepID=A0ABQ8K4Q1_9APHY|nr:uncharacterized protein C8Q71DRAFT_287493 [Rhodofomes roseus]KAH9831850.1 hypothetical protein C8Q71DRAFT_287493 [Rhodofomes roseus]
MASSDSDRDGQDPAASQTGSGSSPPMEGNQGDKGPEPSAKYISPDQAWAKCAQDAWSDETGRVKKWDDEIDNLLVFAGLFSAILTAFVVQYYPTLQTNTNTQPQIVVITASHQTNVTSTYSTPDSDTAPDAFTVAINALWFLALVFSIASASLAISVKQWLAHYVPSDSDIGDTRLRLHIWHLRSRGLARWHVPEIVGILPLLLQIAATFFLTGVVLFLWKLNKAIAYLIIIPVSILLLFTAGSTLVPLVELDCPYKSPVSWWLCTIVSHIFDHSNAQPDADTDGTRSAPGDDALPGAYETDSLPRPRRSSHGTGIPSRILPSLYKCADTCRKALRPLRRLPDAWMAAIQARSCRAQSWADREQQIWRANTTGDLVLKEGIMTAHGEQAIFDNFLQNRPNMVRVRTGPRINGSASPSLAVFEFLADSASEDSLHAIAGVAASVLKTTLTAREHSYPEHDTASIPSDPNQRDANAKLDAKISEMMSIIYWCTRTISTSTDAATQATMIPFREWLDVLPVRTFEHDKMVWDVLFAELSRYLEAQVDPHTEAYRDSMVSAIIETLLGVFVNFFNGCWTPWVLDLEDRFLGLCDKALCPHQTHIMARIIKERPEVGFGLEVASRLSAQGMLVPMESKPNLSTFTLRISDHS